MAVIRGTIATGVTFIALTGTGDLGVSVGLLWLAVLGFRLHAAITKSRVLVWPVSVVGWLTLIGLSAWLMGVRYLQALSNSSRYAWGAAICAAAAALVRVALRLRQSSRVSSATSDATYHAGVQFPVRAHGRELGVFHVALAAGMVALGMLPIVNALGGARRTETVAITTRNTDRPGHRPGHRGSSSHPGNDLIVQFRKHPLHVYTSSDTFWDLWPYRCAEIEVWSGLLGIDWCLGDCVSIAELQTVTCGQSN